MFGLSKERPILDHHPKAHIHEIRRISKDQLPGMVSPMFKNVFVFKRRVRVCTYIKFLAAHYIFSCTLHFWLHITLFGCTLHF